MIPGRVEVAEWAEMPGRGRAPRAKGWVMEGSGVRWCGIARSGSPGRSCRIPIVIHTVIVISGCCGVGIFTKADRMWVLRTAGMLSGLAAAKGGTGLRVLAPDVAATSLLQLGIDVAQTVIMLL